MLDVTSAAQETLIATDFAQVYRSSELFRYDHINLSINILGKQDKFIAFTIDTRLENNSGETRH